MMTYYLGFTDGDEYKVMGLAPYGKPNIDLSKILKSTDEDWNFDWSFIKNNPPLRSPFEPVYSEKIFEVLKQPNRLANEKISQYHKDVASSTQKTFEETLAAARRSTAPTTTPERSRTGRRSRADRSRRRRRAPTRRRRPSTSASRRGSERRRRQSRGRRGRTAGSRASSGRAARSGAPRPPAETARASSRAAST